MADDWRNKARCATNPDPDAWFSDDPGIISAVKLICDGCPVRMECLSKAVVDGEKYGMWGGKSGNQRARIRPRRVTV